jgi:hypothetical protein
MVDPVSIEVQAGCDLLAYHIAKAQPAAIRIATHSAELALAMARRLYPLRCQLLVENAAISTLLNKKLGIESELASAHNAEAAVFPFSLEAGLRPQGEALVVAACRNSLSYKSVRYPGSLRHTIFATINALRPAYHVQPVGSLYAPPFVAWWLLAALVGRWSAPGYFGWRQQAFDRLIHYGPLWALSYVVLLRGQYAA